MIETTDKPIGPPPAHIIETDVRGSVSLYDARTETVVVLNGTASDIWLLCDGEQTLGGIVELLAAAYAIEPEAIRDEVTRTVDELTQQGFLPG